MPAWIACLLLIAFAAFLVVMACIRAGAAENAADDLADRLPDGDAPPRALRARRMVFAEELQRHDGDNAR